MIKHGSEWNYSGGKENRESSRSKQTKKEKEGIGEEMLRSEKDCSVDLTADR